MMEFRNIKQALVDTLGAGAAGAFDVIGYQKKNKSADAIKTNRLVQVYYERGDFPKSGSGLTGPKNHEMSFNIDLTVSETAEADIATLSNPASTPAQRQTALAGVALATERADSQLDELIDLVYQILMSSVNLDLGLAKGTFGSRWVTEIKKDTTIEDSGFAVKTAGLKYTCEAMEEVGEDAGTTPATPTYDTTLDIDGDDVEQTGVTVENL